MTLTVKPLIYNFVKTSSFWRKNYLILREFKYFPQVAFLAVVFSCLATSFEGVTVGFLFSFLQNLASPNTKPVHTGIEWFDIWILGTQASRTERLYRISALILLSSWSRSLFNYLSQLYIELAQLKLVDQLRKRVFEQLQSLSFSFFSKTKSGEILNTIVGELQNVRQVFGGTAFLIVRILTVLIYLSSMFWISWQLSLLSVMLFSLLAVGLSNLNKRARNASFAVSTASGIFVSSAMEFINGIRTVQAFGTQDFERQRYYSASDRVLKTSFKTSSIFSLVKPLAEVIATTILIGMIVLAFTGWVTDGALPVGSLLAFFFILFRLVPFIQDINGTRAQLSTLQGSYENVKELLRTDNKQYFKNGQIKFTGLKQGIDFVFVDFGYDENKLVLQDIMLTIEKGKMTALVGASGAGKTTLADLIPRFYDPTCGQVLFDGIDLRQLEINSVRSKLAVVSQDTFIFNTSLRNNIAYGSERANEVEIHKAAAMANVLEFIEDMPEGFDTQLGDRGVRLSGGQRQRIAIARALLRNPEILILDEATSALDSVSERLIQDSIEKLAIGRTVIAIAHRLSTIVRADKVVVMEQGRIVEQGGYQELLERRGELWKYHQMQHAAGQAK